MSYGGGAGYGYGGGGGGYDANAGGYMANGGGASQGGGYGGGGGGGSQGNGGAGGEKQITETIMPVTIKQIHDASKEPGGDKLQINGATIEQITCVARIVMAEVQMTMMAFKLDDCTGKIDGSHMLPPDESGAHEFAVQKRERLKDNAWVRIVGLIKDGEGEESNARNIMIFKIRAIDDHNELLYHRADVVKAFVSLTRPKKSNNSNANMNPLIKPTDANNITNGGAGNTAQGGIPGGGEPVMGDDGLMMTPLQREIYEYVKVRSPNTQGRGVAIPDIQKDVSTNTTIKVIRAIMEGFSMDGHVYASIDENHFIFCEQ